MVLVDRRYPGRQVDAASEQGCLDIFDDRSQLNTNRAVARGGEQGIGIVAQRRQQLGVADPQRALPVWTNASEPTKAVMPFRIKFWMPCVAGAFNASSATLARGLTPSDLIPSMTSEVSCSTSTLALIAVAA